MTETGFYILLCLQQPMHGYGIVQQVEQLTDGEIRLSPGTMYGTLSKMEKDRIISFVREEEKAQKYNPDDLFKKKNIESVIENTEKDTIENSNLPIEVKKEKFYEKIINFFKRIFNVF